MSVLIFPGRHLLHTLFQEEYLARVVTAAPGTWQLAAAGQPPPTAPIATVVFAITSANHQFTRYNPLPFHVRAVGVDRFVHALRRRCDVQIRILGIPHFAPTAHFAEYLMQEIALQTEEELPVDPAHALVLSSTPALIGQFQALGYAVLPAERATPDSPATPQPLMAAVMAAGERWADDAALTRQIHPATIALWRDFPEALRRAIRLWQDPLLNDDGSLTDTRNYSTYTYAMSNAAVVDLKYGDIARHIQPGRVVDEGCADGALLVRVAQDYPDSDLIGIDISGEMIARALERQRAGEFGEAFVHFHHRNILTPLFRANTIHTTLCNSTLHELWSYNAGAVTVSQYLHEKFAQTAPGGRLLIRDVVGPEDGEAEVLLWLDPTDGKPFDPALPAAELSTFARFERFLRDFLPQRRAAGSPRHADLVTRTLAGRTYIVTTLRTAAEYLAKKDYTDNWASEMHEEFAFWSFSDWCVALTTVGFQVLLDRQVPTQGSHVYTNPWIVDNRWAGKAAIFRADPTGPIPLPFPPTTMVLVGVKPR